MKNNIKHIILLYLIILVLVGVNIISNRNNIFNNNKIILKNMEESTQIADKEKTIDDLNTSQTEYSNYINTSKINLAKAITNAGVSTNGTDSLEKMITNVSKILSTKTTSVSTNYSGTWLNNASWTVNSFTVEPSSTVIISLASYNGNRVPYNWITSDGSITYINQNSSNSTIDAGEDGIAFTSAIVKNATNIGIGAHSYGTDGCIYWSYAVVN